MPRCGAGPGSHLGNEAHRLVRARAEVAPGDWRSLLIFGVPDFDGLRIGTFRPQAGDWPPRPGEVLVERSALPVLRVTTGGTLKVRAPGGAIAQVRVGGLVHDPGLPPGWQDNAGYAYATPETLARLGQGAHLDELRVTTAPSADRDQTSRVAADLAAWLASQGRAVHRVEVPLREHAHAEHMRAMLAMFQVFSSLAVGLGGTLAATMVTALMSRQLRQIGVMKALGATSAQIARTYLVLVGAIAGLAAAAALPLGAVLARSFAAMIADQMLNLEVRSFAIPGPVIALEAALTVGIPLLVTVLPIWRAARRPAREALSHAGILAPVRPLVPARPWLTRPALMAARNAFRRPGRLGITVCSLALGGALLISAISVNASLDLAVDGALAARGDDLDVRLLRPVPAADLRARARAIPGVREAEAWGMVLTSLELPRAAGLPFVGTGRYALLAPPAETRLLRLPVSAGRWPRLDEADAIAVTKGLLAREPALELGARATLIAGPRRSPVRVVGIVEEIAEPTMYASPRLMAALTGRADAAGALRLVVEPGAQQAVSARLEAALADAGWPPSFVMTRDMVRQAMRDHFMVLVACLMGAALAAVAVGGLGLATALGLNVAERTREIGIMRAIGGTGRMVAWVFVAEGALIVAIGATLAVALAVPIALALDLMLGEVALHVTVPFVLSPLAVGAWFGLAAVVTVVACIGPVRLALGGSVVEALGHE